MKPAGKIQSKKSKAAGIRHNKAIDNFTIFLIFSFILFVIILFTLFPIKVKPAGGSDFGEITEEKIAKGYDPKATKGEFENRIVSVPFIAQLYTPILGESAGNKRIAVDLSRQKVYAYENNNQVFDFTVSTGKWAPTPRGNFTIQRKVRAQKMSGGSGSGYYYLPNVPWVMFFGNSQIPWGRGYSFHGTYWHNNFGQPMSHGCINMRTADSATLYSWAPEGTPVQIF